MADDVERRTIERAFHDEVQQHLVGLATGLELAAASVDTDPAAAEASPGRDRRASVRAALEDARRLAHRISPPLLEAGGLIPALRSAAASADVPARIDVEAGRGLSARGRGHGVRLLPPAARARRRPARR